MGYNLLAHPGDSAEIQCTADASAMPAAGGMKTRGLMLVFQELPVPPADLFFFFY